MKRFRSLTLIISVALVMSLMLTGCGQPASKDEPAKTAAAENTADAEQTADETPAEEPAIDISKEVKLYGYLLGAAPAGFNDVMTELNKKLKEDLNATMEISYIGWSDMQAKYPLILAAGEDVDWIFTAPWSFYAQQAAKGAFMELTEEIFEKYLPKQYEQLKGTSAFTEAQVDGKVYMVPTNSPDKKVPAFVYREDLRVKYGVPEINKFSDIEPYLKAIKENEKGMVPMNLESNYDLGTPFGALVVESIDQTKDPLFTTGGGSGLVYKPFDGDGKLYYTTGNSELAPYYVTAAKTMKAWYDANYINKDAFANKVRSKDSFVQGKSGVGFGNSTDLQSIIAQAEGLGYDVGVVPTVGGASGKYMADPYINNGWAISASSKNWERTLMAMDLMCQEESYEHLVYYGIEGVNYVIKDGKIDLPEGITAENNTYPPDAAGFWFTNKNLHLPLATWSDSYIKLYDRIPSLLGEDKLAAFNPNTDNIKTESANCNQVLIQYNNPICLGAVKDVDAAYKQLDEKLKAAGVETIRVELQKQIDDYLASKK
jgi:putative aldouronate transport system substrate-binding protein